MREYRPVITFSVIIIAFAIIAPSRANDSQIGPQQPSPKDRCPVCGMLVSPYPHWLTQIIHEDGSVAFFDGAKDMFTFLGDREKYLPRRSNLAIVAIYVTDYYTTQTIRAQNSFFVIGSDILGPMGAELVAFRTRSDAEVFKTEHGGSAIVSFEEVTPDVLKAL